MPPALRRAKLLKQPARDEDQDADGGQGQRLAQVKSLGDVARNRDRQDDESRELHEPAEMIEHFSFPVGEKRTRRHS